MSVNKPGTARNFDDDAPDLATPEWEAKFAKVKVSYGKPDVSGAKRAARNASAGAGSGTPLSRRTAAPGIKQR